MSSPSRLVMAAGFSVLLTLIVAMVAAGFTRAHAVQNEVAALHENYTSRSETLRELAVNFFRSGIELRDALQDASPERGNRFHEARSATERRLADLVDSGELKSELDQYWAAAEAILFNPTRGNLADLPARREAVVRVALRLDSLNKETQAAARQNIVAMRSANRRFFLWLLAVALAIGLATAVFAWLRVGTLERLAAAHQAEVVRLSRSVVRAQEDERRMIARELHDELGQQLTGMGMLLGSIPRFREDPSRFASLVDDARRLNVQTLRAVRTMALGLRPALLDDLGLDPALRWFTREFSRRSGIPVHLHLQGDLAVIPEPQRTALFRIVQESLTNAARHSHASRIDVRLSVEGDSAALLIEDNGVGFDAKSRAAHGQGLLGIGERVAEFNGRFHVDSKPGQGARLNIRIPLRALEKVAS